MTTAHPRRNWIRHGAAAIIVLALMLGAHQAQAEIRMQFLDVGQGDATLVQTSDGCTLLIDAGRFDRDDMRGHLERHGVEHIDLLVGTHPHADHIGQFDTVLQGWPVGAVWMSVKGRLHEKIVEKQEKIDKPGTREATKARAAEDIERYQGQLAEIDRVKGFRYGAGSDYAIGLLGHSDILGIGPAFIQGHALMRSVLARRFPVIFVDESQL